MIKIQKCILPLLVILWIQNKTEAQNCNASFTYHCYNDSVYINNTSTGENLLYYWTWPGGTKYEKNPVFPVGGFNICLSIVNYDSLGNSCGDTLCELLSNCSNAVCEASFEYEIKGLSVTVTNTSKGKYHQTYWNFGDHSSWITVPQNPFTYTYNQAGNYWINIALSDSAGGLEYGCDSTIHIVNAISTSMHAEYSEQKLIRFFPNPNQGMFSIELGENEIIKSVSLKNILGEDVLIELMNPDGKKLTIKTFDAASGVYLLKVVTNQNTCSEKVWMIK